MIDNTNVKAYVDGLIGLALVEIRRPLFMVWEFESPDPVDGNASAGKSARLAAETWHAFFYKDTPLMLEFKYVGSRYSDKKLDERMAAKKLVVREVNLTNSGDLLINFAYGYKLVIISFEKSSFIIWSLEFGDSPTVFCRKEGDGLDFSQLD
ncbi:MAG: hypothetical protein K8R88_06965 [Armatimonadetes bacterium]|nr:hypothetical protein [Armatimonadota bacterium]